MHGLVANRWRGNYTRAERKYPSYDEAFDMAESVVHFDLMAYLYELLSDCLPAETAVFPDLMWYYDRKDTRKKVAPDVYVVPRIGRRKLLSYVPWIHGGTPTVVIEVVSESSKRSDLIKKKELYGELDVVEYFIFCPTEIRAVSAPLIGYRMGTDGWTSIPLESDGSMRSEELQCHMRYSGKEFTAFDFNGTQWLTKHARAGMKLAQANELWEAKAETAEMKVVALEAKVDALEAKAETAEMKAALAEERALRLELEMELLRKATANGKTNGNGKPQGK